LLEGVEIDLGIDEGRLQVAVTKYVGNLFQRMAPLDHSGCEAVAKRVSAFDGADHEKTASFDHLEGATEAVEIVDRMF
jgi:hypothetical protein